MSITNEIQRLQTAKSNLKTQLEAKGVSVSENATLDTYPSLVSSIQTASFSGETQDLIDGLASGVYSGPIIISSGASGNGFQLRENAFSDCTGITSVNYYAFKYFDSVRLWKALFKNCKSLTAFTMSGPNSDLPLMIADSVFEGCTSLTSFPYLENAISIGSAAFHNCPLTGVTFNSGLTAIGEKAFWYDNTSYGAFSGQGITVPSNITDLQGDFSNGTFQNTCATAFTFMGNITKLGNNYSNSNYCYFRGNSQCELYDFSHNWSVPGRVPTNEFENSKEGYRIVVPQVLYDKWITTQNWTAFTSHIVSAQNIYDVTDYEYSYTGSTAPSISDGTNYHILSNTASDGEGMVTIYGKGNSGLFKSLKAITDITIPSGVTEIGREFCYYCTALTSVTIPNTVKTIENQAFNNCTSLASVTIPDGVKTIENNAFSFCTSLTSVTIPNSVTTINGSAFLRCPFINTGYTFPDGIVTIGDRAFGGDGNPVNIADGAVFNIPDNVTHIGSEFLYHESERGTTYINIGSGITSIGNSFFGKRGASWNAKLYLTIKAVVPPILGSNANLTSAYSGGIYVPAESVDAYKAAPNWSGYADYIYPIPEE